MAIKFRIFQCIQFLNKYFQKWTNFLKILHWYRGSDGFLTTRKSLTFGAARIKKRLCMRDWANASIHSLLFMDITSIIKDIWTSAVPV